MALPAFLLSLLSKEMLNTAVKTITPVIVDLIGDKKEIDRLQKLNSELESENASLKKQRFILITALVILTCLAAVLTAFIVSDF